MYIFLHFQWANDSVEFIYILNIAGSIIICTTCILQVSELRMLCGLKRKIVHHTCWIWTYFPNRNCAMKLLYIVRFKFVSTIHQRQLKQFSSPRTFPDCFCRHFANQHFTSVIMSPYFRLCGQVEKSHLPCIYCNFCLSILATLYIKVP